MNRPISPTAPGSPAQPAPAVRPGRLVVVSGPSGVGKTTLVRRLLARPGLRVRPSVSATTRAPRTGEQNGVDYYFLSRPEFEAARDTGDLLEWAEVHGQLYGTPASHALATVSQGFCVILTIDVQGGLQVRDHVPDAILVWVGPPDLASLEARLRSRSTDDEATILRRLDNARRELEVAAREYPPENHVINHDQREDEAVDALVQILNRNGCGGP